MRPEETKRAVTAMIVPLAIIALGFFVSVLVETGPHWHLVVFPVLEPDIVNAVQIGSGILAVLLWRARDTEPGIAAVATALVMIIGGLVMTGIATYAFSTTNNWTAALVFATPLALAPVLAFHALRLRGWDRMLLMMGAFALALASYSCPLVPGLLDVYSGGVVYAAAIVGILVLFVRGFRSLTASLPARP
ncbi:MAG TPA: hypothetical protein VGM39_14570 [Kofleriaceae bacterium]|jgi:hypothetical protein